MFNNLNYLLCSLFPQGDKHVQDNSAAVEKIAESSVNNDKAISSSMVNAVKRQDILEKWNTSQAHKLLAAVEEYQRTNNTCVIDKLRNHIVPMGLAYPLIIQLLSKKITDKSELIDDDLKSDHNKLLLLRQELIGLRNLDVHDNGLRDFLDVFICSTTKSIEMALLLNRQDVYK